MVEERIIRSHKDFPPYFFLITKYIGKVLPGFLDVTGLRSPRRKMHNDVNKYSFHKGRSQELPAQILQRWMSVSEAGVRGFPLALQEPWISSGSQSLGQKDEGQSSGVQSGITA